MLYVTSIFKCKENMYVCFGKFYGYIILYFLLNALLQILIFLVCYYFSPEVFAISDIISPFLSFIMKIIQKKPELGNIILTLIGYILIILVSFIYNEIIICNFCGLNENTWKEIDKKAENEYLGIEKTDSDTIGDYEIIEDNNSQHKTANSENSFSSIN